jgi:hypothetical protein
LTETRSNHRPSRSNMLACVTRKTPRGYRGVFGWQRSGI